MSEPLRWGRHYLMCPPKFFRVAYQINPWMVAEILPDVDRAQEQWEGLVATLRAAGATVDIQAPEEDWPDLVFTANAGIVNGRQFVPARFRHPERQGETACDVAWFSGHGFTVTDLPLGVCQEGAGDALPVGSSLVAAYRFRSDAASHAYLSRLTGTAVRSVELVDERFYHLDLTLCPLDAEHAIVAPQGWDRYGRAVMEALIPSPLVLEPDEALDFCANSVVVGSTVVMPDCPVRVGRQLEAWGFEVAVCDVSEFLKAGGGCRCLTLALDVTLGPNSSEGGPAD